MYTRNRQNQNQNYANARNQNASNVGSFQSPNSYQGNYQGQPQTTPGNQQQSNYKQGNGQNSQVFKSQQQPQQQQSQMPQGPTSLQQTAGQARTAQQQMKTQQQQVKSQQQQVQQQMQQQQQQPHQPQQTTPQPQRLKPILKQSTSTSANSQQNISSSNQPPTTSSAPISSVTASNVLTPPATPAQPSPNENNTDMQSETKGESMNIDVQEQPKWRRKVPGFKVNKRLKRLRLNQRLRKTLQPKNAIMVLNEMKAGVQFTFPETQGPMSNSLYVVHAELDGKTYVGQGLSKPLARQNAAENALKALLLEKMTAASLKARMDAEMDGQSVQSVQSIQSNQSNDSGGAAKDEAMNEDGTQPMDIGTDESDEIPWSSIASFALYKLFLEWHNQGTSVPVPRPGLPSPVKGVKKDASTANKTPVQKELPPNATSIHPVMLLNQMRPGLTYVELNRVGNPPNTMFTLAVEVDGVEYAGSAKNKKDAKKIAAKAALLALYGLSYPDEVKMEVQPEIRSQDVKMD